MGRGMDYSLSDVEKRIAERFSSPSECSVYETLEAISIICISAGEQRFLDDHLRNFYGVDVQFLRSNLPTIEHAAKELIIRLLLKTETEIAENDLFSVRDALIYDQFGVSFVDQLNMVQLARYIGMMRAIIAQYKAP